MYKCLFMEASHIHKSINFNCVLMFHIQYMYIRVINVLNFILFIFCLSHICTIRHLRKVKKKKIHILIDYFFVVQIN